MTQFISAEKISETLAAKILNQVDVLQEIALRISGRDSCSNYFFFLMKAVQIGKHFADYGTRDQIR